MLFLGARLPLIGPYNPDSIVVTCSWSTFETYAKTTNAREEFNNSDAHYELSKVKVIEDLDPGKILNPMI